MRSLLYAGIGCMACAALLFGYNCIADRSMPEGMGSAAVIVSDLIEGTNIERTERELAPLTRNSRLDLAAAMKARDMLEHQYFAHRGPSGTVPWYWFDKAGYAFLSAGENLAVHFNESEDVVHAWMDSPSHRANILNGAYSDIGIGMAAGTFEGVPTIFVVQLFGTPRPQTNMLGAAAGAGVPYRVASERVDVPPTTAATIDLAAPVPQSADALRPIALLIFVIGIMLSVIYMLVCTVHRGHRALPLVFLILIFVLVIASSVLFRIL